MKNKKYSLKEDVLTLQTPCGPISFKIENEELLAHTDRIAEIVIDEIQSVDRKTGTAPGPVNHYAMLLLAALNLAEKYIRIESQCDVLHREIKALKETDLYKLSQQATTPSLPSQPEFGEKALKPSPNPPPTPSRSLVGERAVELPPNSPSSPSQPVVESEQNRAADPLPSSQCDKAPAHEMDDQDATSSSEPILLTDVVADDDNGTPSKKSDSSVLHSNEDCLDEPPNGEKKLIEDADATSSETLTFSSQTGESGGISHISDADADTERPLSVVDSVDNAGSVDADEQAVQNERASSHPAMELMGQQTDGDEKPSLSGHESTPRGSSEEKLSENLSDDTDALEPPSFIINTPRPRRHDRAVSVPPSEEGTYQLPNLTFLKNLTQKTEVDQQRIRRDAELLEKKLGYFGIKGEVMGVSPGPVITTFEYKPDPGIKISKIVNLADDLALALSAFSIRIVAPIPGKDVMGIEIPNLEKSLVPFIDVVTSGDFIQSPSKVPICLGKDIVGNPVVVRLEKMPHLLIAGATGTGKSVGLNAMITSILYKATPDEVKFLMIDPKRIELSFYNDIPHLLTPVITDMKKANIALQWMVREMDRRYNLLAQFQVRNIDQFNQKLKASTEPQYDEEGELLTPMPFIVVIIDELADLMMTASRDIELSLTRLAQMARAAGIHLILATQRPSVDVLTGIIKANFPTRISFQVSSKTDSRTIIDANGAETLLGNGDMLFVPPGTARLMRVHGTYLSENELSQITAFIKSQRKPNYIFDVITEQEPEETASDTMDDEYDEKYDEALDFVITTRQASISGIQRALRVGYNRAARIIDIMEKKGVVGPSDGIKPRKVLISGADIDSYRLI